MSSYTVRYEFSQRFGVPAGKAFAWCTDYKPDDWQRMGKKWTRKIRRINEDTLVLTDTVEGKAGAVTKRRLVRLHPRKLAWTNTHLDGPNRHSQFWYQIVEEGNNRSRLDFVGLQVNYGTRPSVNEIRAMARELKADDAAIWVLLAKEMNNELGRRRRSAPR